MTHNRSEFTIVVLLALLFFVHCKPVQKPQDTEKKDEWRKEEDPAYVKYLKQVIEILEEDENFSKRLENVTEEDIRSGKIAEEIDFASHHVRTKLDELKRKEIESQRQLLRKQQDVRRGIHREYWNPLNDRQNPNTFEVEDLKKLLAKVIILHDISVCIHRVRFKFAHTDIVEYEKMPFCSLQTYRLGYTRQLALQLCCATSKAALEFAWLIH